MVAYFVAASRAEDEFQLNERLKLQQRARKLMKAVLQRVSQAAVVVDGKTVGAIEQGFMILIGVEKGDDERDSTFLAKKIVDMRIFNDEAGKMNLSLKDVGGSALVISQFTLPADWKKGRRPSFIRAAEPSEGERLYLHFANEIRSLGIPVETGVFGAHMMVSLTNDGPVTMILEHQFANAEDTAMPTPS
jgi:D-tyrosyl-tRNA(Tyr) deacylase